MSYHQSIKSINKEKFYKEKRLEEKNETSLPSINIFVDNLFKNIEDVKEVNREVHTILVENDKVNLDAEKIGFNSENLENLEKIREYYNMKLPEDSLFKKYLDEASLDIDFNKMFFFGQIPNYGIENSHFIEMDQFFSSNLRYPIRNIFLDMDKTLTQQENNLDLEVVYEMPEKTREQFIKEMSIYFYGGKERCRSLKSNFFVLKKKYACNIFVITSNFQCYKYKDIFTDMIKYIIPFFDEHKLICSSKKSQDINVMINTLEIILNKPYHAAEFYYKNFIPSFRKKYSNRYISDSELLNYLWIHTYPSFNDKNFFKNFFIALAILISNEKDVNYDITITPESSSDESIDIAIEYYYRRMKYYKRQGYEIYNIGDSLEKFALLWNLLNESSPIISVPFSGSIFKKVKTDKDEINIIDGKTLHQMLEKYNHLKRNNPNFAKMIEDIKRGKKVLITDFGAEGKMIPTILYLIYLGEHLNPHDINLSFFIIAANLEKKSHRELSQSQIDYYKFKITRLLREYSPELKEKGFDHYINSHLEVYVYFPSFFYINSDREHTGLVRCTPSYNVDDWDKQITDVWTTKDGNLNYFMCNLNRLLFLIQIRNILLKIEEEENISLPILLSPIASPIASPSVSPSLSPSVSPSVSSQSASGIEDID